MTTHTDDEEADMTITAPTDITQLLLPALRARGFADTPGLADSTGLSNEAIEEGLSTLESDGLIKRMTGRINGARLTVAGKERSAELARDALSDDAAAALDASYQGFLEVNGLLKQLTTDWQLREQNGATREDIVKRLVDVNGRVAAILDAAGAAPTRFGRYAGRLDDACGRFASGDDDALARPLARSYHDVWMELHEDYLATLSRQRDAVDGD
jgi:DNA-binding Lrp family transcriptional regulator